MALDTLPREALVLERPNLAIPAPPPLNPVAEDAVASGPRVHHPGPRHSRPRRVPLTTLTRPHLSASHPSQNC